MIKLIILDFDDTIVNNQILDYQSFKNSSKFFKSYTPSQVEVRRLRNKGFLASEIINRIQKKSKINFNEQEYIKFRKKFLESNISIKYLKLQPYVKDFFKKLYSYDIPIVICSLRKHKSIIKKFLRTHKVHWYIDSIVNYEKGNLDTTNPKNSLLVKTKMFKKVMKKYHLKPSEIFSLGNSISDYKSAKECGIKHYNIFFNHNYIPKPKFKHLSSFNEFFKILTTINE